MAFSMGLSRYVPVPQPKWDGLKTSISFIRLETYLANREKTKPAKVEAKKTNASTSEKTPEPRAQLVRVIESVKETPPDLFVYLRRLKDQPDNLGVYFFNGPLKGRTLVYKAKDAADFTETGEAWRTNPDVLADRHYAKFSEHPGAFREGYSGLLKMVDQRIKDIERKAH